MTNEEQRHPLWDKVEEALAIARGNISAAARHAGISWKHFRHKMRELNIRPDAWRLLADNS